MGLNSNRAREVRKAPFGIIAREPVADGAIANVTHIEWALSVKTKTTERYMDKTVDDVSDTMGSMKKEGEERLDVISQKCGERVADFGLRRVPGTREEYYTLELTRENGQ